MTSQLELVELRAASIEEDTFSAFGVVLRSCADGTPCTPQEAAVDLRDGSPRFYLMHLEEKPPEFTGITRHVRTTQTLMSAENREWFIAVAAPSDGPPRIEDIRAFRIPPGVAVTLAKATWHAGPFFVEDAMDFVNLELTDTNIVDHDTFRLDRELGIRVVVDIS